MPILGRYRPARAVIPNTDSFPGPRRVIDPTPRRVASSQAPVAPPISPTRPRPILPIVSLAPAPTGLVEAPIKPTLTPAPTAPAAPKPPVFPHLVEISTLLADAGVAVLTEAPLPPAPPAPPAPVGPIGWELEPLPLESFVPITPILPIKPFGPGKTDTPGKVIFPPKITGTPILPIRPIGPADPSAKAAPPSKADQAKCGRWLPGPRGPRPAPTKTRPPRPAPVTKTVAKPKKRRKLSQLIPLLFVLAGVLVLTYPVVASQYNNMKQRMFAEQYNQQVQQAPSEELHADLERAREYNRTLDGVPILDPWLLKVAADPGSEAYKAYMSQLSRFEAMGRLRIASAKIDLPIRHGTSDAVIATGVGHLYGTALPVGGENTHSVLTSHTGMVNATLFDHLTDVKEGDLMFVDVLGETFAYKVDQIKVVLPSEISDLKAVPGHDYLTVFTCTPYSINSHRLLVRGERVPYAPEMAPKPNHASEFLLSLDWWMIALIAGALFGLLVILLIILRDRKEREKRKQERADETTPIRTRKRTSRRRYASEWRAPPLQPTGTIGRRALLPDPDTEVATAAEEIPISSYRRLAR